MLMDGVGGTIGLVLPRNMNFSQKGATSIDLYVHEIARSSRFAADIRVFAQRTAQPFTDVPVHFWEPGMRLKDRARIIAQTDPRAVIVHQHLPSATGLARELKNTSVALVRHNFVKEPSNLLSSFLRKRQFRRLSVLAFVSESCRQHFSANWPDVELPLFVTPNGIDTDMWRPNPEKQRLIVFTGRLAPEKGVLEVVRGLKAVLPHHPDWKAVLVLASASEHKDYAASVRAEIGSVSQISIVENVPHSSVRQIIADAAIAVAPTQTTESFGRVAIEALAAGAALIATRRGGFLEVIGDAGVLIEPPSVAKIADALEALIADPARRSRLAALGRARVVGRYDLASATAAFDDMVEQLLRTPAR